MRKRHEYAPGDYVIWCGRMSSGMFELVDMQQRGQLATWNVIEYTFGSGDIRRLTLAESVLDEWANLEDDSWLASFRSWD